MWAIPFHPLQVKHLVVTGGSGGLGSAVVSHFAGPDWCVHSPTRLEMDVTSPESVRAYLKDLEPDLLVCAAGATRDMPLLKMDELAWDDVVRVNLEGAENCVSAVLPGMIRRKRGHIVLISSQSAFHPPVGQAAYATSKAALVGLAASLAKTHGNSGIRVNTILPGFMETRMTAKVSPDRIRAVIADHSLGTLNTPENVAKFIRFLEEELPFTSGQVFQLDSRVS